MTLRRAVVALTLACTAFVLSGCFVISKNLPAGSGPINDDRLVGAWQGFDKDDNKPADAFLHFQKHDEKEPLRLVWVEDKGYQLYRVTTMKIANKNVFAAEIIGPSEILEKDMPAGYYLGFYEFAAGGNEVTFHLLDAEKIGKLIESGKVKGTKPARNYDFASLTGSPEELAKFLASPEADAARINDPATIRRIPAGK